MKRLTLFIVVCVCSTTLFSQSITNTLGSRGLFIIKDASTDFLTLNQATGFLSLSNSLILPNTTVPTYLGIIYKGTDSFIHNFGINNTFIGVLSGNFIMTGTGNTALGVSSLSANTTGNNNTAVGLSSLQSNTSGTNNTAVGLNSLLSNTEGFYNTAVGEMSLHLNSTGWHNTALGLESLNENTSGSENTAVGNYSLWNNGTGYDNTAIGYKAGRDSYDGHNTTCIGYDAQPSSSGATNEITLGNGSITYLRCNTQTITSLSDARDKKNIKELNLGIDFLMKIKPRLFNWDKREWYEGNKSDGSKMKEEPTAGFIAQELDEAQTTGKAEWLNLVLKDNPEKWEATPGNLLPVIVKAIQELKAENEQLKAQLQDVKEIKEQLSEIKTLKEELNEQIKLMKINSKVEEAKFSSLGN